MVILRDIPINIALELGSDESSSSIGVQNTEPIHIFYGWTFPSFPLTHIVVTLGRGWILPMMRVIHWWVKLWNFVNFQILPWGRLVVLIMPKGYDFWTILMRRIYLIQYRTSPLLMRRNLWRRPCFNFLTRQSVIWILNMQSLSIWGKIYLVPHLTMFYFDLVLTFISLTHQFLFNFIWEQDRWKRRFPASG